ncbi:ankyrin repeat domain-containing protein 27 [Elysia marginata]|uniref:Ankyrin repeat domain-containing protein 27 n=1 Tax=Elysia marginata TaxID=1093978 RepID=A0AAV4HSS7_9GAST|nr:ankyrin repeat domain-containing protein 27 [Elysia marginata]
MASEVDELEINPFYNALQTKYIDMYERAQECCYTLCVPQSQSLNPRLISPCFVETHILRSSPYFKGQYMTTHSSNSKTLKLSDDNQYFSTLQGFSEERNIKVLSEELAYNKDYKQYKVLIIERPFDPKFEKIPDADPSENKQQMHTPKISVTECRNFLMHFTEFRQELLRLDDSIDYFCRHYMVLPDYLDDAVARLEDISSLALADIVKNLKSSLSSDSRFIEILAGSLESYMMDAVYYKVFPVIRQRFSTDDQLLLSKCHKLNKVNPQEIGVKEEFSCPLPVAVVELANLGTLQTPREKLACLKSTADNVTEGIEVAIQERNRNLFGDLEKGDTDGPCITSDDLIPILVSIISRAKCCHLPSDLFYIENFMWNSTDKDRDDLG